MDQQGSPDENKILIIVTASQLYVPYVTPRDKSLDLFNNPLKSLMILWLEIYLNLTYNWFLG